MTSDNQTESQHVRQGNDPRPQRTLTDSDIEELISFFSAAGQVGSGKQDQNDLFKTRFRKLFVEMVLCRGL
jgi:hypothetical protein